LVSAAAWSNLERYLGLSLRQQLGAVAEQLGPEGASLRAAMAAVFSAADLAGAASATDLPQTLHAG
jgi:hypothetical protein